MNRKIYIRLSAIFFFFFSSWAASYTLISIWFGQKLHLTGAEIGFIFSINSIFTLILQPVYGYLLDKLGVRKNVLVFLSIILALTGPFFVYVYGPVLQNNFMLGTLIGGIFIGGSYLASIGAVESYVEKISRKYNIEYGNIRTWGSLGTAIAAFFAGNIFNINSDYNFWVGSIAAVIVILILSTTKMDVSDVEIESSESVKVRDIFDLFKMKKFWAFVIFIIGITSMYSIYDQQFPRYFAEQFALVKAGNQMYGYLNSVQTLLEAGMMLLAPKIVNKIGARNSMLLMGSLFALRVIMTSLVSGPVLISIIKLSQAFDFSLLYISVFRYININFESRLSSILYLIGYQFINQVGVIGLSSTIGKMYDVVGYRTAYMYMGLIVCCFVVFSFFTLSKRTSQNIEMNN